MNPSDLCDRCGHKARQHLERDARALHEAQEQAAAVARAKQDRIQRWGEALSVLPLEELQQLAQGWSSFTEAVKPAAQRAVDIKQGGK
jgi:hypothetical protein